MSSFSRSLIVFGALALGATVNVARAADWPEKVLWNFVAPDNTDDQFGFRPQMGVLISDGAIYGSASAGGNKNGGTIYRRRNGNMTVLYSFTDQDATGCGYNPSARLVIDSDGVLYGTTYQGGVNGGGVVFQLGKDSSGKWVCTALNSFFSKPATGEPKGYAPFGGLTKVGNDTLYGVAQFSGKMKDPDTDVLIPSGGIIFKLTRDSSGGWDYARVYTFKIGDAAKNGVVPTGPLVYKNGILYGATFFGGNNNGGVIYKVDPAAPSSSYKVLHKFNGDITSSGALKGYQPTQGPLVVESDDVIYGATALGGKSSTDGTFVNAGVVFKLTKASSGTYAYEVLHSFDNTNVPENGSGPIGGLTQGPDGFLYGNTQFGGANGGGSVFRLKGANKTTFQLLFDFPDTTSGFRPSGPLWIGPAGTITGTTLIGGIQNAGNIFQLTPP